MNGSTPWRTTRGSRLLALSQGQNWYKIMAVADGPAQISIYDEIGFFGVSASDLMADLAGVVGPIDVHLNSPGGEVNEGLAIYNCLMARDGVTIYVDGIAASIASVIAMAGDTIRIAPSAQMMVHNPFSGMIGDADDFRAMADQLDENRDNVARIYAARAGGTPEHWKKVMKATGWYRGQEAISAGLADELTELKAKGKNSVAASATNFDMSVYKNKVAARAILNNPIVGKKDPATKAFEQAAENYPDTALAWMHHAQWKGPTKVPIDHVEMDDKWSSGADPAHVQDFVKLIQSGKKLKPVILVKSPDNDHLQLVDGHHRFLAAAETSTPVRAFIGTVESENGAWETMHEFQKKDTTGGKGDGKKDAGKGTKNSAPADPITAAWLELTDEELKNITENLRGVH